MSPKLYFSYSLPPDKTLDSPEPLNAPYTISWHVGRFLRARAAEYHFEFQYVNLDSAEPQHFNPFDVVIGHCWHEPNTFMRQALDSSAQVFILQPYSHHMVSEGDIPEYLALFQAAQHLFFITGEYWLSTMPDSPFSALYPNVTRLDMAVNPATHPYSKTVWNKPNKRGFLAIGNDIPVKGFANIAELARVSGFRLGHYGSAKRETFQDVPQMTLHAGKLFEPPVIASICKDYDVHLAMGTSDACPTTLLEAAAWGLIPICTQESGYLPNQPFIPLKLGDLEYNLETIDCLQQLSDYELKAESKRLRAIVEQEYTWSRFTSTLWGKLSEYLD